MPILILPSLVRESTASFRINCAQAFNGLASVIAPIVASYAFFGGTEDDGKANLESVKWTYVGVVVVSERCEERVKKTRYLTSFYFVGVFVVAILFSFAHIPEVDEEAIMAAEAAETGEVIRRASLFSPHLLLGALALFMYTGAQVAVASMFMFYGAEVSGFPDNKSAILLSVGQGCFTIGRFLGAGMFKFFRADHLMIVFSTCAIISNIVVIVLKVPNATYALLALMFFESILFPTIFSLGSRDLGRNHKRGSAISKFRLFLKIDGLYLHICLFSYHGCQWWCRTSSTSSGCSRSCQCEYLLHYTFDCICLCLVLRFDWSQMGQVCG